MQHISNEMNLKINSTKLANLMTIYIIYLPAYSCGDIYMPIGSSVNKYNGTYLNY